jgi:hypothetical protein
VFSFLPGCWLFIGAVCREWRPVYAGIADQDLQCFIYHSKSRRFKTCGPTTTSYSAAVASPATVRLAASCGLAICKNYELQVAAGLTADTQTLVALLELGMSSNTLVNAVALSGRLNVLQHLFTEQKRRTPSLLSECAARSGSINMLNWLRDEKCCTFDKYTCAGAAEGGHLALLQHLRSEGCEWDAEGIACRAAISGSIEVVEWLRQQQGVEIDSGVMMSAASAGQTAMCQHLRAAGCEWDSDAADVLPIGATLTRSAGCERVAAHGTSAKCASMHCAMASLTFLTML